MTPESATAWKAFFDGSPAAPFLVVSLFSNAAQWLSGRRDKRQAEIALASVNEDRVRMGRESMAAMRDAAQLTMLAGAAAAEPPHRRKAGP